MSAGSRRLGLGSIDGVDQFEDPGLLTDLDLGGVQSGSGGPGQLGEVEGIVECGADGSGLLLVQGLGGGDEVVDFADLELAVWVQLGPLLEVEVVHVVFVLAHEQVGQFLLPVDDLVPGLVIE